VRTTRGKSDDIAEPSSLPLWRVSTRNHSRPLSIARYVHFRPMNSGTWVPGKYDPVANQHRKRQGLSRLRSSGREHISLLTHIHRLNLDHQGGALKSGQLRSRCTVRWGMYTPRIFRGSSCISPLTPVHPTRLFPSLLYEFIHHLIILYPPTHSTLPSHTHQPAPW
jgi:hypothetical protein